MKTLTTLALTAALAATAISVQAADRYEQAMAICSAGLRADFGDDIELNLVKQQRHLHGTRITVAARLDADNSRFATCWVEREETAAVETPVQQDMLATTESTDW